MKVTETALYVHFPWCVKKCPYCDFNSHPLKGGLDERAYLKALKQDLVSQLASIAPQRVTSVFFGGGTPSLFSPDSFAEILDTLGHRLTAGTEVTLEANPGATEHGSLAGYRRSGINRLSFGAQSFDDESLKRLGRIHSAAGIRRSYDAAREAGFENINLDLMYGLPGQTAEQADTDLKNALSLAPEHLSWYQLTIEPRTEFAQHPPSLPSDDALSVIEQRGFELLDQAGYTRYEVSAYARGGTRCEHNANYWKFGDYLGIGAGAHGKITSDASRIVRTAKPRQPRLYMGDPVETTHTTVGAEALPGEFMMNALRLVDGVDKEVFERQTGLELSALEPHRRRQIADGHLHEDRLAATPRGYALLDGLIADYL